MLIRASLSTAVLASLLVTGPAALAQEDDLDIDLDDRPRRSTSSGSSTRLGIGVETILTIPFAPAGAGAFIYDAGQFRIEGLLFLLAIEDDATTFGLGGRFFYVMHRGNSSDFGLGGSAAIVHAAQDRGPDQTRLHLEGAAQIRIFLSQNVALTTALGLGFAFGDGSFVLGLGGQLTGTFGLHYFF